MNKTNKGNRQGRPSYDEVLRENKRLQAKVDSLQTAMREANRLVRIYHADAWVATPLHPAQEAAIMDRVQEYCSRNVREGVLLNTYEDGTEKWEQTWMPDDWLLPNCRWFLVHYEYQEEQGTFNYRVWGMMPA